jgi:hypothetical protein
MKEKITPVAFPSFQSRVHYVHTTLKTARKQMAAATPLLLPTPAQENAGGFVQKSKTQNLPERKPHAQKLLTQFLRHLPTHHPEIEVNRITLPKMTESKVLQASVERKEARMAWHYIQRAVWQKRALSRWIAIRYFQICGLWRVCESSSSPSRHYVTCHFRTCAVPK